MKTYTEEDIRSLIDENLKLIKELTKTQECLEEETRMRKSAEREYNSLCERCMSLYISDRDITTDTVFVQLNVPRFMNDSDLATGITQHLISIAKAERERHIFNSVNMSRCKTKD